MKLKYLFEDGKRKILLISEGGAGKSSCAFDTFLFYSRNYERYRKIPVYIPLNRLENKDCPVYSYFGAEYVNTTDKTVLHRFLSNSRREFLFLLDGLNEIPNSGSQIRQNAIRDILDLSEIANVSVLVTSRYQEDQLEEFERYELSELSAEYLQTTISGFNDLSDDLRSLLLTPFNLCLYLNLSDSFKNEDLKTSGDLIRANISMLRGKLCRNGHDKKIVDFLFDVILPVIAYQMCQKNEWSFYYSLIIETAEYYSDLLKTVSAYSEIYGMIRENPVSVAVKCKEILSDNAVVYSSEEDVFSFLHEQYRDYFGALGWFFIAENFKLLYKKEGESLKPNTFSAPVCTMVFITETVNKKDNYFNILFDKTTRGIKHSRAAARFNQCILGCIGFKERKYHLDFHDMDLTQIDFSNSCLDSCDFSGAVMSETAFSSAKGNPLGIWNNDDMAIVFYGEGVLRCVSIHTAEVKAIKVPAFNAYYVREPIVYLYRNKITSDTKFNENSIPLGEVFELDLQTWKLLSRYLLIVPETILLSNSICYNINEQLGDDIDLLSTRAKYYFSCKSFVLDMSGRIYVLTDDDFFCFSEHNHAFLQKESLPVCSCCQSFTDLLHTDKYVVLIYESLDTKGFSHDEISYILRNTEIDLDNTVIERSAIEKNDTVTSYLLKDTLSPASLSVKSLPISISSFVVYKIDECFNETPVKLIGVYQSNKFAEYGRILRIIPSNECLHIYTENGDRVSDVLFYPETKEIKISDDNGSVIVFSIHQFAGFKSELKISTRTVDNINIVRVMDCHISPSQSCLYYSKRYISCFNIFHSKKLFVFPIRKSPVEKTIPPIIQKGSDTEWTDFTEIFNTQKPGILGLIIGKNLFDYNIISKKMTLRDNLDNYSFFDDTYKRPLLPDGHDDISFSLLGTERLKYSKYYFRKLDYSEFDWEKNGSVDCFHHLCDDTFEIQGITDSKPQEQRDNAAQTLLEIYQCKFQTALSGNEKSMTVMYMLCVYHRFLLAICEATSIIDSDDPSAITLLVLDLKSNKLTRIDTNLPVDSENRNDYESCFIWVDSSEVFDGFNLNHIFYLAKDILYELSINLENRDCTVRHEVMLFPSVELLNCKFDDTEVVLNTAREKELKSIEAEKKKILDSWKENVIVSPDKE